MGLCLSLVIIAITATFAITMVFSKQIYNGIISNISQRSKNLEGTEEINKIIVNNFYGDLSSYNNNLGSALAEGYVDSLNDSNCRYMTASEYAEYKNELENGITGAGVEATYNYKTDELVVTCVYEGSPAENEGLLYGDVISAVGGVPVTRSNYRELCREFTGGKLQNVKIEYVRNNETKTAEPMLGFSIPSVTGHVEGTVGYVRISGFNKSTAAELKTILDSFKELGAEGVVIDLRNVSGGTIKYAAEAVDVIVPGSNGCIAIARNSKGKDENFPSESSSFAYTFAVLINSGTSGPAELFACDMRELKQAMLIGTRTAGVGTMQSIFTLDDGGAILLTVALVIPAADESLIYDGTGVAPTPSMEIPLNGEDENVMLLSGTQDNQLSTAMSILSQ